MKDLEEEGMPSSSKSFGRRRHESPLEEEGMRRNGMMKDLEEKSRLTSTPNNDNHFYKALEMNDRNTQTEMP